MSNGFDFYYVTGATRGLGGALTRRLLETLQNRVVGLARGDGVDHPHYRHARLDLADSAAVAAFDWGDCPDARRVVLVNNAALHEPKQMGHFERDAIARLMAINAVAPLQLMNAFLARFAGGPAEVLVCNVTSSGAHNPVRGSSIYCASKAAIEIATRVAALEAESAGNTRVRFLIADPGGMASDMWAGLMKESPDDLPDVVNFRGRNPAKPEEVAARLARVLAEPSLAPELRFKVQELAAV